MLNYSDERFADLQLLRYQLPGFEQLTLSQKRYIYALSQATLYGRDITFDQFGKYNLRIRKTLEAIYTAENVDHETADFQALEVYLKRVWFSNGIYHHYGCEKFLPGFSENYLREVIRQVPVQAVPLRPGESLDAFCDDIFPVIFNPAVAPKRVNKADGEDLVVTSSCNFYQNVSQQEAEAFYQQQKESYQGEEPPSFGLNSTLIKQNGRIYEDVWRVGGRYSAAIENIVYWLEQAKEFAENDHQRRIIGLLVSYYQTGDLQCFNEYCKEWVSEHEGRVDFVNGFIEVYGDPLGFKGSWEGIVEYKDLEATRRTQTISTNAQWFEDHSPVDPRFRKKQVKGVTANAICAAMLGGDEYPSTAIGINLPNADWIRAEYGSKSITISNITDAYNKASHGNGFKEEFVIDEDTLRMIEQYGDICDELHTDLHECLGHGSGQLLPDTDPDALKAYGNTIEEARADLFGLYYIADAKLVELGLTPNEEAYKSQYYSYIMNGLLTQLIRIQPGNQIEEDHMRNRALIAHWCYENGKAVDIIKKNGKTYVQINDYQELRRLFATLLAEIQRIKSEGDYEAARQLVERYAVNVDPVVHQEILERYERLHLAPYKGFINPRLIVKRDAKGEITDILADYTEGYAEQMLRYSSEYGTMV